MQSALVAGVRPRLRASAADLLDEQRVRTLAALYSERRRLSPAALAFRFFDAASGTWQDTTWGALGERADRYIAGLRRSGLKPGDRVAVQIDNAPEWFAIDWAVQHLGLVMVALYAEDTPTSATQMISDSTARLAFLPNANAWRAIREVDSLPSIEQVVLLGSEAAAGDWRARSLASWLPLAEAPQPARAEPAAMATIIYTSGATGRPKGTMMSHANIITNVFACLRAIAPRPDDTRLSVLPLAHSFERTAGGYLAIASGMLTVFGRGQSRVAEDLLEQRPTLLIAVPRLFEKIHGALQAELSQATAPKRALFRLAVEAGWRASQKDAGHAHTRLLPTALTRRMGQQLQARLGGRLRLAVSGGAALAPDISRLFIALGVPLLQGYGLTEAGPVVAVNREDDNDPSSAGLPLDNVETRVGPGGELLVRSPSVMMGYWRDPEASRAAIDDAGWLHTGDKVSRLDTRRLFLTGRIKEIIVTATGEKASPADIEIRLRQCALVDQVMVVGEAKPYLGALVVPDRNALLLLRVSLGLDPEDQSDATREELEQALLRQCVDLLRQSPKNHQVRRVSLVPGPWTTANGLLTASQKLKRSCIEQACLADVERLYAGHVRVGKTDCSSNAGVC